MSSWFLLGSSTSFEDDFNDFVFGFFVRFDFDTTEVATVDAVADTEADAEAETESLLPVVLLL